MFQLPMRPNAHSTLMNSVAFSFRLNSHKLPTTLFMVEEAILELNNTGGISLRRLTKYISEKYQIDITARRYALIKEHLRAQLASGTLVNISGRGLSGSFRLRFKTKSANASKKRRDNGGGGGGGNSADQHTVVRKRNKATGKNKSELSKSGKSKGRNQKINVASFTRTPPNCGALSMAAPHAPHRNSMAADSTHVDQGGSTPLSAGERVGRKRRLLPTAETQSQGF